MRPTNTNEPFCKAECLISGAMVEVFFFWPANYNMGTDKNAPVEVFEDRKGEMIPHMVPLYSLHEVQKVV